MSKTRFWLLATMLSALALSANLGQVATGGASNSPTDEQLWRGAADRIERYRKADAVVQVTDSSGRPIANASVNVQQQRHSFLFGCNIFLWGRVGPDREERLYRDRFAEVFNYATLPFYWPSYQPRSGQPRHEQTELVAGWCREHGIATKGHPLAWNYAEPDWLPDDLDEVRRLQMARIADCVVRFKGLIECWDVVNEPTHFERKQFAQRAPKLTALWQKLGRIQFIKECFASARKANPTATLLVNDYRVDEAYAKVLEQLRDEQGRPIYDAIGIQSHMHGGTWSNRKIWEACERFARFGRPLHFTETTILSGERGWELRWHRLVDWRSTAEGEGWQAAELERFYTMVFSHPAVEALTWWDFADRRAWQGAPAGLLRRDLTPKPAYERLRNLIKGKWWTRLTVRTSSEGQATFRGFLGDYKIMVEVPGKKPMTTAVRLAKGAENRIHVVLGD